MTFDENPENIYIYQYVEEMFSSFLTCFKENREPHDISYKEIAILLRIRFNRETTQHDLVQLYKVSSAYIANLLKKLEDAGYIERHENKENKRKKMVKLTEEGIKKTDEYISLIEKWEKNATEDMEDNEIINLKKNLFKLKLQ